MKPRKYSSSKKLQVTVKLWQEQDFKCAICRKEIRYVGVHERGREAALDHCHLTGFVRGVLCCQCNTGLGQFGENPALLARAILYLTHLPQRLSGFEDGARYVPIWPIYCGDKTVEQIPQHCMDIERQDFEEAMRVASNRQAVLEENA